MKFRIIMVSSVVLTVLFPHQLAGGEPNDYLIRIQNDSRFSWDSISNAGIAIYYQKGSFAAKHRIMLLSSLENSVSEVLGLLQESEYTVDLNVFYLESRDEMEAIVGKPYTGFANWSAKCIFLVLNPERRSFERHEFAHIVTMGLWGRPNPTSRWMIEGIPVYCDGWCQEYTVHQIALNLLKANEMPELGELFDEYVSLGEIRAGFSAASFISFIAETYGPDKLRELWHLGSDRIEEVLGDSLSTLETSWRECIQQSASDDIEIDLESIMEEGCG
jgi:hypothetical protein